MIKLVMEHVTVSYSDFKLLVVNLEEFIKKYPEVEIVISGFKIIADDN